MNRNLATLLAVTSALALAVPAAAHPGPSGHPGKDSHPSPSSHPSQSHRCASHNVAYVESGTIDSATVSTMATNPDGTRSGTLVVDVKHANHWAKADEDTTVTYTFANAKLRVHFDGGATAFTAGDRVQLIGKLATVGKNCTALSPAATPAFRALVVHPAF